MTDHGAMTDQPAAAGPGAGTDGVAVTERIGDDGRAATAARSVLDAVRHVQDALSVRRVFGEPYESGGTVVIPVARVMGGGGGGGGEGASTQDGVTGSGNGVGTGFGVRAHPVGAYVIRDGSVSWQPSLDVTRIVHGVQALVGLLIVSSLFRRRRRPRRRRG